VWGNAVFLSGRSAVQYQVSPRGAVALDAVRKPLFGSAACSAVVRSLVTAPSTHLLEHEHARVMARSLGAGDTLTAALAGGPALATVFPSNNSLADQLKMVARMISTAAELGARRQVFFVSLGGFDTHAGQSGAHPALMTRLAAALQALQAAIAELGVADRVTTFTASDFGRTLAGTDDSDHGWGATHLILGGAVNGGRLYGTAPVIANNGPDDVGLGRRLPSASVDQYAAKLGRWFGISDTDLLTVLPNLGRWDGGVGFV
jgi:uncharacterized protein (DUF1501 family)